MHAFFELHIEQGPILEAEDKDIGVVTHGQGLSWTQVTDNRQGCPYRIHTHADAQGTPGLAMARVLEKVDEIAWSHAPHAVGAAGHIDVFPNSRNVIPGKVVFTVDFRSPDLEVITDMERNACGSKAAKIALTRWAFRRSHSKRSAGSIRCTFDEGCVTAVRERRRTGWAIRIPTSSRVRRP